MSSVNKVILVGRLGVDPEIRSLKTGGRAAFFSLATTEKYKDKTTGESKETTEWHRISLWSNLAEVAAKYLHKGDLIYLEGKLQTRSWEQEGVTRYATGIVGNAMTMLSTKQQNTQHQPATVESSGHTVDQQSANETVDDLPF